MTNLHFILIGLAVVLVGGLALYNYLQERRLRRQVDRMFSGEREDVRLGDGGRLGDSRADDASEASEHAPRFFLQDTESHAAPDTPALRMHEEDGAWAAGPASQALDAYRETRSLVPESPAPAERPLPPAQPVVKPPAASSPRAEAPAVASPPPRPAQPQSAQPQPTQGGRQGAEALDSVIEYVARVRFTQPAFTAFAELLELLRRIGKPVRAVGERADGGLEAVTPHPASPYTAVEVGIQLADRNGPLSEAQLDRFCQALYEFATLHGGAVSCPDRKLALEQARELDQFCIEVDVLIGLNIVSSDRIPFDGPRLRRIVEDNGMQLGPDGTFILRDSLGRTLFSLVNQESVPFPASASGFSTHGITLLFDVPRIEHGLAVFDKMTHLAFDLAEGLPGKLVDDSGRAVSQDSLQKDRQRLDVYYARMLGRNIPPGGERAMRLFA